MRVSDISKSFSVGRNTRIDAVRNVSFEIARGEVLALAGESGSGKSTLARLLLGTMRRDSGVILLEGREVDDTNSDDLAWARRRCSFVHQDPYDSMNPQMSVEEIIAEPLQIHGVRGSQARRERVLGVLSDVGLEPAAEFVSCLPHELSGGQRQRVSTARAISLRPALVIADEPVSMLDVSMRADVLDLMRGLRDSYGAAFLYITHDLATARHFADSIALMYRGSIVEHGPASGVLDSPRHPYTRALLDALPLLEPGRKHNVRIREPDNLGLGGCAFRARCPCAIDACKRIPELEPRGGEWGVACFAPVG